MKQSLAPSGIIAVGLLVSQAIFTIFVYQSNVSLLESLRVVSDAGYLTVPNAHAMSGLDALMPAFCGGLFFTLTAGAGLTIAAFVLIYVWHSVLARRPELLFFLVILWELGIYKASQTARPLILTSAFILLPALVSILTLRWASGQKSAWNPVVMHLAALLIIVGAWLPNVNGDVFIDIRDQLLLENPIGQKINSFYYHYTLYPAEAFKSLDQKQIKTARIRIENAGLSGRVEKTLRRMDYLPVNKDIRVDLTIEDEGNRLSLIHGDQPVLHVKSSRFLNAPESTLKEFSKQTDRMQILRKFTFFSLITASPLLLYLLIYTLFLIAGRAVLRHSAKCGAVAAVLAMIIGVAAAAAVHQFQYTPLASRNPQAFETLLQSKHRKDRIKALKRMDQSDIGVSPYEEAIVKSGESPHITERYWAARLLGDSDSERTYRMLSQMLNDPHPNVACMALYSLGRRNEQRAVPKIKRVLTASTHWYTQWYAYNALKELGWTQPESV